MCYWVWGVRAWWRRELYIPGPAVSAVLAIVLSLTLLLYSWCAREDETRTVHLLSIVQDLTEDLPGAELVRESAGEGEKRGTMVRQDAGEDIAGHERHSTIR